MPLAVKGACEPEIGQRRRLLAVRAVEAMARGCHDVWCHAKGGARQARALAEKQPDLCFEGLQPAWHGDAVIPAEHRHGQE